MEEVWPVPDSSQGSSRHDLMASADTGKTVSEFSRTLKISLPRVQNIKKTLGLVQKRKK